MVDVDLLLTFNCGSCQVTQTALPLLFTFLIHSNFLIILEFKFIVSGVTVLWHNVVKFKSSFE